MTKQELKKLLSEMNVSSVDELKALVAKGRGDGAAPSNGNGNGNGGAPANATPSNGKGNKAAEEATRRAEQAEAKLKAETASKNSIYWNAKLREHALRAGIRKEEYLEAAIAILKQKLKGVPNGQQFDIPAFFETLKTESPALFEAERVPANTQVKPGVAPAPPNPTASATAGKRVTEMNRSELAEYKRKNGIAY